MDDLVAWLRAQIDEDERHAREADLSSAGQRWYSTSDLSASHHDGGAGLNDFEAEHIARHDPARVLREVDAKRRILDHIASRLDDGEDDHRWEGADAETDGMASTTLHLLALPYADRPGYRDEWRP